MMTLGWKLLGTFVLASLLASHRVTTSFDELVFEIELMTAALDQPN
jgi:hypothetical protein